MLPIDGPINTVAMFPGQGSQRKGMGADLFDKVPEFKALERHIDAELGYSLRSLCLNDPDGQLNRTQYTQPALYVMNALHYLRWHRDGGRADAVLGHSLGEYNALLAAGVFDLMTGLRVVKQRGLLMANSSGGGMLAVVGLTSQRIEETLRAANLRGVDLANFNAPHQTVISGPVAELKAAESALKQAGARMALPLPVSAAFHSRYMQPAAQAFGEFLQGIEFRSPMLPVVANVTGESVRPFEPAERIKTLLVQQIAGPVRWLQSIGHLTTQGTRSFIELGPGNVLTKLVEQIRTAP